MSKKKDGMRNGSNPSNVNNEPKNEQNEIRDTPIGHGNEEYPKTDEHKLTDDEHTDQNSPDQMDPSEEKRADTNLVDPDTEPHEERPAYQFEWNEMSHSKKNRKWIAVLTILIVVILAISFWLYWIMQPVSVKEAKTVEIPLGSSTSQIASILHKNDVIRSELGFKIYLKFTGQASDLQPGVYHFRQGQSLYDLVQTLKAGDKSLGTVRFTIPEGFTIEQIADLLQKKGVVSAASFIQEADHGTFDSPIVQQIPKDPRLKHRLEGYLFPDTYEIYKGATAHDIIEKMLARTDQILTSQMRDDIKKRNLSVHQIFTVASMIEREAKVNQERPEIAGVIYNRLAKKPPMPLQIDATVEYVVGPKDALTDQDLKKDSPYNTYLHEGLPPGPIASPGILSIKAAIYPDHNSYYFYVVKNDGTGEHYFAKTYDEQLQNEQKSEQNALQQSHS